jgi:hypothetical protein
MTAGGFLLRRILLALAALPLVAAAPAKAEPVVLKPAGPWNLDVGENRCRLNRLFGEPGNQHLLALEQHYPGSGAGLFMAGPAFKPFSSGARTELRLFEGQTALVSAPFTGAVEEFGPAVIYRTIRFDGATPSTETLDFLGGSGIPRLASPPAQARSITVAQGNHVVTLETGPFGGAFAALNRCSEDLIRAWGLDLEQHRTASRRPVWQNREELNRRITAEFPIRLARNAGQAIYQMRVIVSPQGTVEDCQLASVVPGEEAQSPACKRMEKARFEPALDAAGQPMRSYYVTSLTYETNVQSFP